MNTAVLLSSNYDLNFSEIYVIDLHWANITVNGSMAIAGITLLIGNSTTYGSDTAIITEQGYGTGHLIGSDGRICDDSRNDYDLRCDFDGDGCAEIEKKSDVSIDTKVEFVFRGMSENASAAAGHTNVFALPENISKMMESASGNETLQAVLHGAIRFAYTIDNKTKHGGACATKPMVIEQSLLFNSSFSCLAA
jgi:hypothetical protein